MEQIYLSLTACKELGIVHADFPRHMPLMAGAARGEDAGGDIPERPTMLFKPFEENVTRLGEWLVK